MNKRTIYTIIFLISFALIGLVAIQLYWMESAVRVKEQQFDHTINSAIQSVIHKIETQEAVHTLAQWKDFAERTKSIAQKDAKAAERRNLARFRKSLPKGDGEDLQDEASNFAVYPSQRTGTIPDVVKIRQFPPQRKTVNDVFVERLMAEPLELQIIDREMENLAANRQIVVEYVDSSLRQLQFSMNKLRLQSRQLKRLGADTIHIPNIHIDRWENNTVFQAHTYTNLPSATSVPAQPVQATRWNYEMSPRPAKAVRPLVQARKPDTASVFRDAFRQAIVSSLVKDRPLEERISKRLVDSMIKGELHAQNIHLPYEYGVVHASKDSVLLTNSKQPRKMLGSKYKAALFSNPMLSSEPYTLVLRFPEQKFHIFKSLGAIAISSLAFIVIIIFSFSFTVFALMRQKKISDIKSDFINNMTHEFKTPIATIALASEALSDPDVHANENRVARFVKVIYDENKRLGHQVERVLQAAVLDREKSVIKRSEIELHDIIQCAISSIAVQIEQRGGQVVAQLGAMQSKVLGDKIHLGNVIYNLLDNANKYSPENPEILVSTKNVQHGVVIAVEDNGLGISRDAQKMIFEKFYRVPTGNLHNVKGFGLGLHYVRTIVEAHGGTVSVRSRPGKGSRFEIFLPLNQEKGFLLN